jgi:rare lipoprotein A
MIIAFFIFRFSFCRRQNALKVLFFCPHYATFQDQKPWEFFICEQLRGSLLQAVIRQMNKRILAAAMGTALVITSQLAYASVRRTGIASWYKMGKVTANGERFNPNGLTAAHRYLPFGTRVRVTNLRNGRKVVVRINDRGPFIKGRIIDLAYGAARKIGLHRSGTARVRLEIIRR